MASDILRTIRLDDSAAWEGLRPGEFAVFLSDTRSDILLDAEGRAANAQTSVPVFESQVEAERYAEQTVVRRPSVCAAVYDYRGRSGDPVRRLYHESVRKRFDPERRARRYVWTGGCLLGAFTIWA